MRWVAMVLAIWGTFGPGVARADEGAPSAPDEGAATAEAEDAPAREDEEPSNDAGEDAEHTALGAEADDTPADESEPGDDDARLAAGGDAEFESVEVDPTPTREEGPDEPVEPDGAGCEPPIFGALDLTRAECSARVVTSDRHRVRIEPGPALGLTRGERVAFYVASADGEVHMGEGRVARSPREGSHVVVEPDLGVRVPLEARAVRSPTDGPPVWNVPRVVDRAFVRLGVGGVAPTEGDGGLILSADVAVYLEAPIVLRAGLAPLAYAGDRGRGVLAALGYASVGLDLEYFELSLGGAATTINQRHSGQAKEAPAALLGARFGPSEGFSLEVQLFFTMDDVRFDLGVGRLRLNLPLARELRLVHRADVGRHGLVNVDVGLVGFLLGRGDSGSLSLGLFAGIGHVYYESVCPIGRCPRDHTLGPSFGLELGFAP